MSDNGQNDNLMKPESAPQTNGHADAEPAWRSSASLSHGSMLAWFTPATPRPFSGTLAELVKTARPTLKRLLRRFAGAFEDRQAVAHVAPDLLRDLQAMLQYQRKELLERLSSRCDRVLGELIDVLRLECWLAGKDAVERLIDALAEAPAATPAPAEASA